MRLKPLTFYGVIFHSSKPRLTLKLGAPWATCARVGRLEAGGLGRPQQEECAQLIKSGWRFLPACLQLQDPRQPGKQTIWKRQNSIRFWRKK